jgi:glyoxylase-like metal-dependent hydrolase (beta-lactamase superfamily II)
VNTRRSIVASCLLLAALLAATDSGAQTSKPDREISQVKGNLYRARSGAEHTVFLVTAGGIVIADPISVETAQWLKAEFERRIPPGVVRYVVYTNHRSERATGGVIFDDRAELVGHREFNAALSRARKRAEPSYRGVRDAESHFDDTRIITIGGGTIELVHAPTAAAPEGTVIVFRTERTAFVADAPLLDQSPFSFGTFKPRDVRQWLATVSALDFDVLLLGDGRSIQKSELVKLAAYVDEIVRRVAAEYESGRSAAEFTQTKLPPAFRSDAAFRDWRSNVSDAYGDVSVFTIEATVGAMGTYIQRDDSFCTAASTCSTGGGVPAGITSLSASFGRWSLLSELTAIEEMFSSRTTQFYDEDFALRETRVAVMLRRNMPAGAASLRLLGGMSYAIANRSGLDRVKGGLPPFAGRHRIQAKDARYGVTGGLDLVVGRRLGIVVPLRFNYAVEEAKTTWPSRMDVQAGVAITLRLFRTID